MKNLVCVFLAGLVGSAAITPLVRRVCLRWGVIDHPDGGRKLHDRPVPVWGGVAVYLALIVALVVARLGSFGVGEDLAELSAAVMAAAGLVCFFGCIDDYHHLSPRVKLLLQTTSVLPIVMVGYSVEYITAFNCMIHLGPFGVVLSVLWLVGCINAINLLDGMDGLASMVGLFTSVMMAILAIGQGNYHVALVAVALAGALGGFLIHNRPPASIFLGDSGSMVIGLVVGILGVRSTMKTSATLAITAPLVVMTFPIFDTFLAVVRRKLTGRRFDAADRQHIHHRLLDRGMHPWLVLGIIGALCLAAGIAAIVANIVHREALAWITAAVLIVMVIRMRLFGHHELALVTGALARGMAGLTRRLGRATRGVYVPEPQALARLGATAVWASLVRGVQPWTVRSLQVILRCQGDAACKYSWAADDDAPTPDSWWSIAVRFRCGEEGVCELWAAGWDVPASGVLQPAGLLRVLNAYGKHFAEHPEQVVEFSQADENRPDSASPFKERRVAA
jgi:UDP-GlcNAc:undecaprenyl-phosphate GlcNAc-1-phosphate transferase